MAITNSASLLKEFLTVWARTLAKNGVVVLLAFLLASVATAILALPTFVWGFTYGYHILGIGGPPAETAAMPLHLWLAQGVWVALVLSGVWSALEVLD